MQAKTVKETMDKKFAPNWHCFIGQGFGFEVVCCPFCVVCVRAQRLPFPPSQLALACSALRTIPRYEPSTPLTPFHA